MKLNNIDVFIQNIDIEKVDGEFVMYNSTSKQVIMFNSTASLIWRYITTFEGTDKNICTIDIVNELARICNLSQADLDAVSADVDGAIQRFSELELIKKINENQRV